MFDSGGVFEEVLSRRLTGLHAFALFVACDRLAEAEALLSSAVARALERSLDGLDAAASLDESIVELALQAPAERFPPTPKPLTLRPGARRAITRMDPVSLRGAAARIPPAARVAIWLVTVERRSYAEAARLIGVGDDELVKLLEWRDPLIRAALAEPSSGDHRVSRIH